MRLSRVVCLFLFHAAGINLLSAEARADTIVLKNGRRIVAANVVEENGRVSYETSAGRLSLRAAVRIASAFGAS